MQELVTLKGNDVFTDSLIISKGTGITHRKLSIRKHQKVMERFGKLSAPYQAESTGGRPEEYYLLNEEFQADEGGGVEKHVRIDSNRNSLAGWSDWSRSNEKNRTRQRDIPYMGPIRRSSIYIVCSILRISLESSSTLSNAFANCAERRMESISVI